MAKNNTIEVLNDLTEYATRYGYDALGYAIAEMAKNNTIHLTQSQMCELWEFGGNTPEWANRNK